MFSGKVAVITGGAQGIGRCIAEEFEKNGATVLVIDKQEGNHFVGDISDKTVLESFAYQVIEKYGRVDFLINNALPIMKGIDECSYEEFSYALSVGVTAPFYLTKLFMPYFAQGASVVNISSSRDRMSQPQTESYTAAKGGIAALTHAMAVSLSGKARVNSISPGWIDTSFTEYSGSDAVQHPAGRVGNPLDIANMVLYLCSDKASFITPKQYENTLIKLYELNYISLHETAAVRFLNRRCFLDILFFYIIIDRLSINLRKSSTYVDESIWLGA